MPAPHRSSHRHARSHTAAPASLLAGARREMERQAWPKAQSLLEQAVRTVGDLPQAWQALAEARLHTGDVAGSASAARRALALDPRSLDACLMAATGLLRLQRHAEAVQVFEALPPDVAATCHPFHACHGEALLGAGRPHEAVGALMKALALKMDDLSAHSQLGFALRALEMHAEAAECFRTVAALDPNCVLGHAYPVHWDQFAARWADFDRDVERLLASVRDAVGRVGRQGEFCVPFALVGLPHHPQDMLAAARLSADFLARGVAKLPPAPRHARGKRLRIGYLSSDFHTHATAALLADVLEQRDRERFEVVLFSHGRDDASPMRQRIEAACDRFVDVRHLGLRETAAAMREARIDIAVDLKGFTADNRLGALAARPAPVQASWLGFPGTSGADFIDYIIGDPVVTPLEHAAWYSECIAQMPVCYQPNDARRPRPGPAAREAHGLPRDAFVLGSFNHPFKITPALFDAWAAILRAIPEAIVWQRNGGAQATENLRREAQRRGVDPARLVIAPDLPMQAHLERLSAADLALDTWPCNGHTTTSDALWAGVPVVTIKGLPFASRVAASLLHAVGLPELVCDDIDAYVKRVIALHGQPDERAALRARLVAARDRAPLFDSRRFAHDLERLYERMWARHQAGLPPQALPAA